MDGVEVCRTIRKAAREPYIYIILLTARGQRTEIVEGLEAGADDYITKPFDLHELKARLRTGKRILALQQQLVSAREQLRVQANHDSLTGLYNRMAIMEILEKECARSRRDGSTVAVMMADLDNFKHVNDTHGHQAGDTVLKETARKLMASVRSYDSIDGMAGRICNCRSGMQFGRRPEQAERLRLCVSAESVRLSGVVIPTTMSIGVAAAQGGQQSDELLNSADEALYVAKKLGRNRVAVSAWDNLRDVLAHGALVR